MWFTPLTARGAGTVTCPTCRQTVDDAVVQDVLSRAQQEEKKQDDDDKTLCCLNEKRCKMG